MELTYYDTRPKEEQSMARPRESEKNTPDQAPRDSLNGPRQLKPVTRRPLPADPVNGSSLGSADHLHPAPRQTPPRSYESPSGYPVQPGARFREHSVPTQIPSYSSREPVQSGLPGQHTSGMGSSYNNGDPEAMVMAFGQNDPQHGKYTRYNVLPENNYGQGISPDLATNTSADPFFAQPTPGGDAYGSPRGPPPLSHHQGYETTPSHGIPQPAANGNRGTSPDPPSPVSAISAISNSLHYNQSAPPIRHHHSTPSAGKSMPHLTHYHTYGEGYHAHRPEDDTYEPQSQQLRHHSHNAGYETQENGPAHSVPEDVPPPPPAHRTPDSQVTVVDHAPPTVYQTTRTSAPLDTEPGRATLFRNPANARQPRPIDYSVSPPSTALLEHHQPSPTGFSPAPDGYTQSMRAIKTVSFQGNHQKIPQSLIPGYDARTVTVDSAPMSSENGNQFMPEGPAPYPTPANAPHFHRQHGSLSSIPPANSGRSVDAGMQRPHRGSVPLVKPTAMTADPVRVPRKSVSPRPAAPSPSNRLAGVPFSPDAYDALNPNAGSASVNAPGARYRTPEEAEEVSRQRRREAQRGPSDEPIIGWDGQVIDPSDHLPSDTWAPEPEKKGPAQTPPQPEQRSRPSLQGAQPMPSAGRRPARPGASRPHSMSTPPCGQNSEPQTPSSTTRARLQKRMHVHASSPNLNSSPLIPGASPGVYGGSYSSTPRSLPRNTVSTPVAEYPLREHENYGYERSPAYSPYENEMKSSPIAAGGPPVPAKVPIRNSGREDYSALSEELSTIDIGSGNRRRVAVRRSQY